MNEPAIITPITGRRLETNAVEAERALRLLSTQGETFEIRAIVVERDRESILFGYFRDPEVAAKAIARSCGNAIGIYKTLNPVRPELHARCGDRLATAKKGGTTGDQHITKRTRLLIDIDVTPVAGISSTDAEHDAALMLASEVADELTRRGWPRPLNGDSGNGAQLDYAIDLPVDDGGLVKRVLEAAQARWGCEIDGMTLKVDTGNFNPARIGKVFGTPAKKGDNTLERPHRVSRIISAPDTLEVVTREQLEAFADEYAPKAESSKARSTTTRTNSTRFDLVGWLDRYSIGHADHTDSSGKLIAVLEVCPFNSDHGRGEAHAHQMPDGMLGAECKHESCTWGWRELRERFETDAYTKQATRGATSEPRTDVDAPNDNAPRLTELGNSERFARRFASQIQYVSAWGKWVVWDGQRWKLDDLGTPMELAKLIPKSFYEIAAGYSVKAAAEGGALGEVTDSKSGGMAEAITKWARASSKRSALVATYTLAQSDPAIAARAATFDLDPFLFNVENGTLDLRDGTLRPHRQADKLTKLAAATFNRDATCPRFLAFIERVLPDADVRRWLQRYIGYALTGSVREQILAFAYGSGANGKSVLFDVLLAIWGDYGVRAAPDLLLAKYGEAHPTELADLEGRRMAPCSEIDQGRAWDESTIKRITGDTTITARKMRQDFTSFPATHKLVVLANTMPTVRGTDHGIWRRMRLVPFTVTIPEAERDAELVSKLLAERDGILAWAVRGCLDWQREGLGSAAAIDKATKAYRDDQDLLGNWIADCCALDRDEWTSMADLYWSYKRWSEAAGGDVWTKKTVRARLLERDGLVDHRKNAGRGIKGIAIKPVTLSGFGDA